VVQFHTLYYANRVFQLPLAIFAIATSIALFPMIAKAIKNKDENRALI
jgi:putative peptidoglycan lipid II flippase